jgi:NIPSNAP
MGAYQLRDYRVKPGEMVDWIAEWTTRVRPLRQAFGFMVVGAWVVPAQDRFIWILGRDDFEAVDERYYNSVDRLSIHPDPARHLAHTEQVFMESLEEIG